MKQRISALDLQILTSELVLEVLNYRLQNIYNVATSARQFLLKFLVPDSKKVLVLDCGNKIHLTEFERPTTQAPSNFVTKLRKHLKTRRLSQIKQIGNDRVLVLQFSDGLYYLVLEFFSAGNILLLDHDRNILALQRMVNDKGDNDRYAVNETYKMFDESLFEGDFEYSKGTYLAEEILGWITAHKQKLTQATSKKNKVFSIHKLLFVNASHLLSDLIQSHLTSEGLTSSASALEFEDGTLLDKVVAALERAEDAYLDLIAPSEHRSGYIVAKKNPLYNAEDADVSEDLEYVYDEFLPFKPPRDGGTYRFVEVDGYNKTLDKFFSTLESTKFALRIEQQKQHAAKRLEHARLERDRQIQSLVNQQELNTKKGDTIMYFPDLVEDCKAFVQRYIDQQMDWTNIESVIKLEQSRGNDIAQRIKLPLNLKDNKITLVLPDIDTMFDNEPENSDSDSDTSSESDSDSDSDGEAVPKKKPQRKQQKPLVLVVIDLGLSAFANAREYFGLKRTAETKKAKVEKSTAMALQNAQKKISRDLAHNLKEEHDTLKAIRPKYWFEKFFWFVSSEGYLCLAGRDDSQTDMIYYRHFSDNDAFVSSDVEGSLKVFVKNHYKGEPVPPSTLMQAGIFAMSASSAWNGKVTTSAWVLHGSEISKKDFDGSLIRSGHFNYKAKKEYLPPAQLVMGFALYFLGDEEATKRYREVREARQADSGLTILVDNKKRELAEEPPKVKKAPEQSVEAPAEVLAEVPAEIAEVSEQNGDKGGSPEPGKRLSAKEKRALRKSKSPSPDEDVFDPIKAVEKLQAKDVKSEQKPPTVRGKKGKMKKIAAKYAEQDDEERRLRMEVLGTLKQVEKKQEPAAAPKVRPAPKKKQDEREYEKYLQDIEEESAATNHLEILDLFISKPDAVDGVSGIIPVFAPWTTLNKFKYKAKVQPGNGKKGKALNDTLHYFTTRKVDPDRHDADVDWPNEHELLSGAKTNDLIGVFTVSKLKLVLPGNSQGKKKK